MCDHMANSKAYVSFVLLFTFLLSSHVLTHELPEEERIRAYTAKEVHELVVSRSGRVLPPHLLGNGLAGTDAKKGQCTQNLLGNGIDRTSAERGGIGNKRDQYTTHLLGNGIGGTGAERDQYAHSVDYQPSGLVDNIEPKNYKDGTVMSHRKMMRPSAIDWKSFHDSQAKTSSMTHGSKSGYDGVPKMEEVDEGIMN